MTVLVACEFSGRVRDAFLARGIDAVSCDLLPSESPGPHIQGDVLDVLDEGWDMVIAHPPCTRLSNVSARWIVERALYGEVTAAAAFFLKLLHAAVPLVAVENPKPHRWARAIIGRPDFYVEPWQFGDPYTKRTGFWVRGLPPLLPLVAGVEGSVRPWVDSNETLGAGTKRQRAYTFPGVAAAIAQQWGALLGECER